MKIEIFHQIQVPVTKVFGISGEAKGKEIITEKQKYLVKTQH